MKKKEQKDDSLECGIFLWFIGMLVLGASYITWQLVVGNPEVTGVVLGSIAAIFGVLIMVFVPILFGYWAVWFFAGKETADILIDGMNRKV